MCCGKRSRGRPGSTGKPVVSPDPPLVLGAAGGRSLPVRLGARYSHAVTVARGLLRDTTLTGACVDAVHHCVLHWASRWLASP